MTPGIANASIAVFNSDSVDVENYLLLIDQFDQLRPQTIYFTITEINNPSNFGSYRIDSVTDQGSYYDFSLTFQYGNGNLTSGSTEEYSFSVMSFGDGPTGPIGPQGATGPTATGPTYFGVTTINGPITFTPLSSNYPSGSFIDANSTSGNIYFQLYNDSISGYPVGSTLVIGHMTGASTLYVMGVTGGSGAAVFFNSGVTGATATVKQKGVATLYHYTTDRWVISGDIV